MSGQQIGTVVGGVIGAYFGGPAGAQLGMAIGGAIGGAVDPTHINGPKIGDGQQQSATDGNPIAWVQGTAMVAGTIVQVGPRRQIRHKDNGKGSGTEQVTFTAQQDFAILVCESCELRDSTMSSVLMVMQDGKIVYDIRDGTSNYAPPSGGGSVSSAVAKMLQDSFKWKANVDFMFGDEDQMPHPTLEAITGVGNTPAYRGSLVAVFKNFDVSAAGDRIPNFQFVVAQNTTQASHDLPSTVSPYLNIANGDDPSAQYSIGGGYYDIALNSTADRQVRLYSLDTSALRRWIVIPLFDDLGLPHNVPFLGMGAVPFLRQPLSVFDTGWFTVGAASWSTAGEWLGAWSAIGESVPPLVEQSDALAAVGYTTGESGGVVLELPYGTKAIRIISFETAGSGRPTSSARIGVAQSSDPLFYTEDGRYVGSDGLYLSPWAGNRSGLDTSTSTQLAGIVSRVCKRGGLTDADIDVTDLSTTEVAGYPIARQANAADCLLPLMQAYFGYGSEYDALLHFKFYGADAGVTIDADDLIEGNDANNGAITKNLRNQETEFPRRIVASYMDPAQNYGVVNVAAERRSIDVIAIGDQSFQIPVVMAADDAAKAADKALKVAYATLEGTIEYSVPFAGADKYITLAAGEPLLFAGKRYIADEMVLGNGTLKLTTRYDRQSAYTSTVQAIPGNLPTVPTSSYSGPTTLIPMNLPSLRPQDTYGAYLAAASAEGLDSWAGCTVQASYDGQQSWVNATAISSSSTFGVLTTTDTGTTLIAQMNGDLDSVTDAQITAQANAFALVHDDTHAEIGQFKTATEDGTTADLYTLTDLTRGELGTTQLSGVAGDKLVMLDAAYFLPIDVSFAGQTLYFRAVGFGETAESAVVVPFVYSPDLTVIHDGGVVS